MKPERIKRLFKAYLGIGFLFMLLVCIGIVFCYVNKGNDYVF